MEMNNRTRRLIQYALAELNCEDPDIVEGAANAIDEPLTRNLLQDMVVKISEGLAAEELLASNELPLVDEQSN